MQHISNLINGNFQQTSNSKELKLKGTETGNQWQQSSRANLNTDNADRVWDAFTEFYGRSFLTEFGELPNKSWIEALEPLSPLDVERGIKASQASGSDFAPRLPRFLAMCQPPIVEDVYRHERETQILLERRRSTPNASDDVKKQALAEMKNLLKFKPQGEMR